MHFYYDLFLYFSVQMTSDASSGDEIGPRDDIKTPSPPVYFNGEFKVRLPKLKDSLETTQSLNIESPDSRKIRLDLEDKICSSPNPLPNEGDKYSATATPQTLNLQSLLTLAPSSLTSTPSPISTPKTHDVESNRCPKSPSSLATIADDNNPSDTYNSSPSKL